MARTLDEIRDEVLELSDVERRALAEELIDSLAGGDAWHREWIAEAQRRYREIESGAVPTLSREEFMSNHD
jgi:putative addiction module component (TIGR02574 family)